MYAGGERLSFLQAIRLGLQLDSIEKQLREQCYSKDICINEYIDNAALSLLKNKGEKSQLLVERAKNYFKF